MGLRKDCLHDADELLTDVSLIPLDEEILTAAETVLPSTVATLDAIHLATAVKLASTRLADGARQHGLAVLSPN